MKKVVILIDGQNLYYGLNALNLKEREINWSKLFQGLLEPNDEMVRAYWFRPQRILDGHLNKATIKNQIIYKDYKNYYEYYKNDDLSSIPGTIMQKIDHDVSKIENWLNEERTKFKKIEYNYDQLCLDNSDIEIVKKGIVKVNPYKQEYNGEKGVDIALAVKMISLSVEKKCDKIILVSGDYDYAEAITYVKNQMTKVHVVKLHKGVPPKNRNMSRDLSVLADKVIDLYEEDIKSKYIKSATVTIGSN